MVNQWQLLHRDYEKYEHFSLLNKICAFIISLVCFAFSFSIIVSILLLALIWLQEAILKTYQGRTAAMLVTIESRLSKDETDQNKFMPIYQQWQSERGSISGLLTEYAHNAFKPTVMTPYIPLMIIFIIAQFL